jgi:cysteinyl-tRNA synthetase
MSKSLGNLYTLDDLTAKGFSPMAVRYALLAGHPRKQLNFTLESLQAAEKALNGMRNYIANFCQRVGIPPVQLLSRNRIFGSPRPEHAWTPLLALGEDLNLPDALGEFFNATRLGDPPSHDLDWFLTNLGRFSYAMGFRLAQAGGPNESAPQDVIALAEKRWAARLAKDFKTADALRKELAAAGWAMLDGKDAYKLEPLKK